ncbi:MAG: ATP synthase F0 subunit C [Nannocystaceae bacterium]
MTRKLAITVSFLTAVLAPALAMAAERPEFVATSSTERAMFGFAMALAIGLAALGGGLGQGRAVAAALEGICRNPNSAGKVLVPMLLGLAFVESLVIFALIISFTVSGFIVPAIG